MMRAAAVVLVAGTAWLPSIALGQHTVPVDVSAADETITVTATKPCAARNPRIDYACLNSALRSAEKQRHKSNVFASVTAQADTPSRVGTFSHSATAQRMGSNFGRAATPFRPAPPVYAGMIPSAAPAR